MTNIKAYTRGLSGRARILFAELATEQLKRNAGEPMTDTAHATYERRVRALQPADRKKFEQAFERWRARLEEAGAEGPEQEAAQQAADRYLATELDALALLREDLPRYCHAVATAAALSVPAVKELAQEVLLEGPEDPAVATRLAIAQRTPAATWQTLTLQIRERPAAPDVDDADPDAAWAVDRAGAPTRTEVYVHAIVPERRAEAIQDFLAGDLVRFFQRPLLHPLGADTLDLFVKNAAALAARGLFERGLALAYRMVRPTQLWPRPTARWLFALADRDTLRACGDPLPGTGPYRVYRGGRAGLSWTPDPAIAALFAARSDMPIIRAASLTPEQVFVYFAPGWVARTAGYARPTQRDLIGDVEYTEFIADADGAPLPEDETAALIAGVSRDDASAPADPVAALSQALAAHGPRR